jgi:hypothetical protein
MAHQGDLHEAVELIESFVHEKSIPILPTASDYDDVVVMERH